MVSKLVLVTLALASQQWMQANGVIVDSELKLMNADVKSHITIVTAYAANENPSTLTEQKELANILKQYVELFHEAYETDLENLLSIIKAARQNADFGSASALCYKLQETKIDPARENGVERAKVIDVKVDQQVNDLVESTKKLIDETKLDLDVKTIVQLCMKIYTGVGQDKERLQCFDEYGAHLSIGQKSKGETLLERVGTIQQQFLRISLKTDKQLREMFAEDQLDYSYLDQEQVKCSNLPGSNAVPSTTVTPPSTTTPPPTTYNETLEPFILFSNS